MEGHDGYKHRKKRGPSVQDREKDYGRQHGGKREVDAMLKRVTDSLEQTERNPGTGERRTALQSGNEGQQ